MKQSIKLPTPEEQDVIGKMITFSEDCKNKVLPHYNTIIIIMIIYDYSKGNRSEYLNKVSPFITMWK